MKTVKILLLSILMNAQSTQTQIIAPLFVYSSTPSVIIAWKLEKTNPLEFVKNIEMFVTRAPHLLDRDLNLVHEFFARSILTMGQDEKNAFKDLVKRFWERENMKKFLQMHIEYIKNSTLYDDNYLENLNHKTVEKKSN